MHPTQSWGLEEARLRPGRVAPPVEETALLVAAGKGLPSRKFAFIRGSLLLESAARNHPIKERAS